MWIATVVVVLVSAGVCIVRFLPGLPAERAAEIDKQLFNGLLPLVTVVGGYVVQKITEILKYTPLPSPPASPAPPPTLGTVPNWEDEYKKLTAWARQAVDKSKRRQEELVETRRRYQRARLTLFGGLAMAVGSCCATFVFPPADHATRHMLAILAGYCLPALAIGIISQSAVSRSLRDAVRIGFFAAFWFSAASILISLGYQLQGWQNDVDLAQLGPHPLLQVILVVRLGLIPAASAIASLLGAGAYRAFVPPKPA